MKYNGEIYLKVLEHDAKILTRLEAGEKLIVEDQYYLTTIKKDGDGFWAESWPAIGTKLDPVARQCSSLAEAFIFAIGEENITWKF